MREYRESVIEKEFIELEELNEDQFLTLKETLTRIGFPAYSDDENEKPTLWQTVHVFHSMGKYYLVHFKQMFLLDGKVKSTVVTDMDRQRLWSISFLINKWGLAKVKSEIPQTSVRVKIVPFSEKNDWQLKCKYTIGVKKGDYYGK